MLCEDMKMGKPLPIKKMLNNDLNGEEMWYTYCNSVFLTAKLE